jgi:glycogen debranching enzyme
MADRPLSIDIHRPLLLKANDLVLLTREDGDIPLEIPGFGLFYRDTCYLGAYTLRLHGTKPLLLMASDIEGMAAQIELTNSKLSTANGNTIPDHKLSLRRTLLVLDDGPVFVDTIAVRNFADDPVVLPVSLEFHTTFESMFMLRGAPEGKRGRLLAPVWDESALRFYYEGADGVRRTLLVEFSLAPIVAPRTTEQTIAHFELTLAPRVSQDLVVSCRVDERPLGEPAPSSARAPGTAAAMREAKETASKRLLDGYARLETSSKAFGEVLARSLSDLALLEVRRGDHRFTAAGIPWFVGLFGRDSLLPTIQCLAFNPDLGARTTRALAHWQGKRDDEKTREQPGKILHELRVGELAHLREVTQTPSYAAVDSTLLFLIAIARHVNWTGDLALFRELRVNIDAALGWLERKLAGGEGYVTYDGLAEGGQPVNQSWRDSGTGVLREDGTYPAPPLALVEVQGYAFQAMTLVAGLLRRVGEAGRAEELERAARELQERFLREFWMEAEGCYCLALEQGGRQVASVTSNAAQVLWTGIASPEHAARVAARVMRPDMFSGWGVRTLSADHAAFDPLAYQQGSVWAFDNALIVSGLRRYGEDAAALRVTAATLDAADGFRHGQLPPRTAARVYRRPSAPARRRPDPHAARRPAAGLVGGRAPIHAHRAARLARGRLRAAPDRAPAAAARWGERAGAARLARGRRHRLAALHPSRRGGQGRGGRGRPRDRGDRRMTLPELSATARRKA